MISTLFRQKYAVMIIVIQIAVTMAILSNSLFIVSKRFEQLQGSSGIDEVNTFVLTSSGFTSDFNPQNAIKTDLDTLRKKPNVVNAVATYAFPYSGSSDWDELQTEPGKNQIKVPAASYKLDEHGLEALGVTLIAGENFTVNEVRWQTDNDKKPPASVIISKNVAKSLFNTTDWLAVVGKTLYINENYPAMIKGIVDQLQAPWNAVGQIENSVIYPIVIVRNSARYFIRTAPNTLQNTIAEVEHDLSMRLQTRMIRKVETLSSIKKEIQGPDIAAITILMVVIASLTVIAALGIAGLASFNVVKRHKQIGIRRALGATRLDILNHFYAENILQTTCGVLIGGLFAISLNVFLVEQYALVKLPLGYIFVTGLCMYFLGLMAILKPALKAINISPAQATRRN
jgi:putative ABC transport system permease protein